MDTADKSGKPVTLCDSKGNEVIAVWRQSRKFGMTTNPYGKLIGKWSETGFWSLSNFAGVKISFVPRGWHP
jgi:hypothetical protein